MNINRCLEQALYQLNRDEKRCLVKNLIHRLLIEHQKNDKSGIYGKTQYMFAYYSNHTAENEKT